MPRVLSPGPRRPPALDVLRLPIRNGRGTSQMNAIPFGAAARERLGTTADEPNSEKSSDAAWIVLEAANDLGDHATVEACRRVIDASLNGAPASPFDMHVVSEYFR